MPTIVNGNGFMATGVGRVHTLLDISARLLERLAVLVAHDDDGEPPPTKGGCCDLADLSQ